MPDFDRVNLRSLHSHDQFMNIALSEMSRYANGPLRLEKTSVDGQPVLYLRIRSWTTFFRETLSGKGSETVRKAELKTAKAIDQYVRPYLKNVASYMSSNEADLITFRLLGRVRENQEAKETSLFKSNAPADTNGKVSSFNANNRAEKNSEPNENKQSFCEAVGTTIRGMKFVPSGISFVAASAMTFIADVRLLRAPTLEKESETLPFLTQNNIKLTRFSSKKHRTTEYFRRYYLSNLNRCAGAINASALLELRYDLDNACSPANMEGAYQAAKEFIEQEHEEQKKSISIALVVPTLPTVEEATEFAANDSSDSEESSDE